jgi:hypothetical protein
MMPRPHSVANSQCGKRAGKRQSERYPKYLAAPRSDSGIRTVRAQSDLSTSPPKDAAVNHQQCHRWTLNCAHEPPLRQTTGLSRRPPIRGTGRVARPQPMANSGRRVIVQARDTQKPNERLAILNGLRSWSEIDIAPVWAWASGFVTVSIAGLGLTVTVNILWLQLLTLVITLVVALALSP